MKFSKRTEWTTQENALTQALREKRRHGIPVLDLTQSNPTQCGFEYLNAGLLRAFSDTKNLCYHPDPRGLLEAREAICRYYAEKNISVVPEQLFLTAGTSEAYGFLFRLLADPGDTVLAPQPSYPLFDTLSDLNDVRLEKYPLIYDERWSVDLEAFESLFHESPRAVVVVNPNNPTGNFISEKERKTINELCGRAGAAVIADEVFLDFSFQKFDAGGSFASHENVLTFTLSGLSKILGLPQMKVSWIVVSGPEVARGEAIRRLEIIADTYLSVNTPSQTALSGWLSKFGQISKEIQERVLTNRQFLSEKLRNKKSLSLLAAQGGWQAILQIDSSSEDEALALELLEKKNISVYPGYFFDFTDGCFLVLSLLLAAADFQEAIDRLLDQLL